jgi:hypothetical protein
VQLADDGAPCCIHKEVCRLLVAPRVLESLGWQLRSMLTQPPALPCKERLVLGFEALCERACSAPPVSKHGNPCMHCMRRESGGLVCCCSSYYSALGYDLTAGAALQGGITLCDQCSQRSSR